MGRCWSIKRRISSASACKMANFTRVQALRALDLITSVSIPIKRALSNYRFQTVESSGQANDDTAIR